ncbi:hypothetical protein N7523_010435 [Penicillium sp. IBT 18751x]|nr:hypothetical protein N7523_010435 [Penicillium sp. IBT 18751x]
MTEQRTIPPSSPPPESPSNSHYTKPGSTSSSSSSNHLQKRVSTACLACKKSKRKCSGSAPCANCTAFHRTCIFDESLDQRRRVAAKRTADELSYHRDLLNDLFELVRSADEPKSLTLLDLIRRNAPLSELRSYIDGTLSALGSRHGDAETLAKLEDMKSVLNVEDPVPTFRSKVMDIHYLCDEATIKVPAWPWTSVSGDDELVSHLVSLYFTWDHPVNAFIDEAVFLRHMVAKDVGSLFCTPFLVNALLSNACYYSGFSEAYVVPGDISSKGCAFLAEAERLKRELPEQPTIASLQGTLLMYGRYAMSRNDDLGYITLHEAIRMGEALGLVGDQGPRIDPKQLSRDMDSSCRRTAWGLFNIDTTVHTGFLRPCLISQVNLPRPERNHAEDQSVWRPYPTHRETRPSFLSLYFEEACNLSIIARDISRSMFANEQRHLDEGEHRQSRQVLYERLNQWYELLPDAFEDRFKPPPHILLLKMRHHTLTIHLFSCNYDSKSANEGPQNPESAPRYTPDFNYNALEIAQSAARSIAALTRLLRRENGVSRAHHFAMYAINVALFTMLEQESFDLLDPDFLSLTSAFSVVASRSALGRNLFHIFRQSVRAKAQGDRIRDSDSVTDDLKNLFDEETSNEGHSRYDEYADGLEKLNQKKKYNGIGKGGQSLQNYAGLGLSDMLDRYESLSLGKDDVLSERHRLSDC